MKRKFYNIKIFLYPVYCKQNNSVYEHQLNVISIKYGSLKIMPFLEYCQIINSENCYK